MLTLVILLPAFVAAFSGAVLILWMVRPAGFLGAGDGVEAAAEGDGAAFLLRDESLSSIGFWGRLLERFNFTDIIRERVAEAHLDWSVGRMTAMMLLSGVLAYAFLAQFAWLPGFAILGGIGFGALIPYFYVTGRRRRRFARFEQEFPDALDSMCRALRAGHALPAAIEMLAHESVPPVSTEMRKVYEEWKLGMNWEQALDNLATRVPLPSVSLFAAAVKLHNRTGGKLGQMLEVLGESMREANALQGEIRAVAAHGRLTAGVLTVIPVLIGFVMSIVYPAHLAILFQHPHGKDMVAAAICCVILAHFVMRKITDIRP